MKIPHSIRIDRETVRVVYGDPQKESGDDKPLDGLWSPDKNLITLNASLRTNRRRREWSFWHEVAHAIEDIYGLPFAHGKIHQLGRALAYLFEDNRLEFPRADSGRRQMGPPLRPAGPPAGDRPRPKGTGRRRRSGVKRQI